MISQRENLETMDRDPTKRRFDQWINKQEEKGILHIILFLQQVNFLN